MCGDLVGRLWLLIHKKREGSSTYVRVKLLHAARKNVKSDLAVIKRLECFAGGHVLSITRRQVGRRRLYAWCLVRLRDLIGKVHSDWLQAALSISNPNGRCRVKRRNSGKWRTAMNGQRLWGEGSSLLSIGDGVEFECWSRLKTNYTPTLRWRCQFSRRRLAAVMLYPHQTSLTCIVTYCFHY